MAATLKDIILMAKLGAERKAREGMPPQGRKNTALALEFMHRYYQDEDDLPRPPDPSRTDDTTS